MSRRQHSGRRATNRRRELQQQASVGLGGPGARGVIGANNRSTGGRVDIVKEIMERHLAQMKKGLSEASAAE